VVFAAKGKEDTRIRVHAVSLLIDRQHYSISGVLQFCERYMLEYRRKTVISVWY